MPDASRRHRLSTMLEEIVSGRQRDRTAMVVRGLLRAAEIPYHVAVAWRNRRFDRGQASTHRVDVPVISVGNVTLGGTGKTPLVAWLSKWFRSRGVRVALISRGYGTGAGTPNDEALELAQELPDVPHVQNADRVAAAQTVIEQFAAQLILLDDAFQHRRLERDLDVVLVDALKPFGYEHLLPRGLLREPLSGLVRAQVIAVSRCDLVAPEVREAVVARLRIHAPEAVIIQVAHRPQGLVNATGQRIDVSLLADTPVAAFCGIGNPEGFRRTLAGCGWQPTGFREFADHHAYSDADAQSLSLWASSLQAGAVLCTRKDLVKIGRDRLGQAKLWALEIGIEILAGREDLEKRLQAIRAQIDQPENDRQA